MAFIPKQYDDGKLVYMGAATTQTIVKGDALYDNGSGYLEVAVAADGNIAYVAMETVTTTANGERVLCLRTDGVTFEADCASGGANPAQTDVGTLVDLSDKDELDLTASTTDVFFIESIALPASDKKVIGHFRQQPDA
jgi:hypothetical protein